MQGTTWIISRLSTSSPRAYPPSYTKRSTTWTTHRTTTSGRHALWNAKGSGSTHKQEALLTSTSAYQQHHDPSLTGDHESVNPASTLTTQMLWTRRQDGSALE